MDLIAVPAARVELGLSERAKNACLAADPSLDLSLEYPPRSCAVEAFAIATTPTTNAEYLEFVAAGGYRHQVYWEEDWAVLLERGGIEQFRDRTGSTGPLTWIGGRYPDGKAEHPVSGVSWFEARAFCRYLGHGLRLPRDAEWELAARGEELRLFPWGGDANDPKEYHRDNLPCVFGADDTAPVSSFPAGRSKLGVAHLAGNVAEWCEDAVAGDDRPESLRVVRGDFFRAPAIQMRATLRNLWPPQRRFGGFGFRCAVSLPSALIDQPASSTNAVGSHL